MFLIFLVFNPNNNCIDSFYNFKFYGKIFISKNVLVSTGRIKISARRLTNYRNTREDCSDFRFVFNYILFSSILFTSICLNLYLCIVLSCEVLLWRFTRTHTHVNVRAMMQRLTIKHSMNVHKSIHPYTFTYTCITRRACVSPMCSV